MDKFCGVKFHISYVDMPPFFGGKIPSCSQFVIYLDVLCVKLVSNSLVMVSAALYCHKLRD